MTTKMQQETPSQAVVITKENVAQTKRPDSHRNQWVQTEPREKTEEQQKVGQFLFQMVKHNDIERENQDASLSR